MSTGSEGASDLGGHLSRGHHPGRSGPHCWPTGSSGGPGGGRENQRCGLWDGGQAALVWSQRRLWQRWCMASCCQKSGSKRWGRKVSIPIWYRVLWCWLLNWKEKNMTGTSKGLNMKEKVESEVRKWTMREKGAHSWCSLNFNINLFIQQFWKLKLCNGICLAMQYAD